MGNTIVEDRSNTPDAREFFAKCPGEYNPNYAPRVGDWTTHWDDSGHWTGEPGAVFAARPQGGSFRGGGQQIIGYATTVRGALRVARRWARESEAAQIQQAHERR